MKTTKTTVILLAVVLLTTAQPVEAMVKPEISNTQTASCLVKITTSEAVLPLDEFAVEYLMKSSGVAGKAAREVLETSPDIVYDIIEIEEVFGGDSSLSGYGVGLGAMDLPADATPGAFTPGAATLGTTTTNRSTGRTTPTAARTPSRPPTTTTSTSRPTTPRPAAVRPPTRRTPTPKAPRRTRTVTPPPPSTTEQTILFRLQVMLPNDAKPAAEEFMIALIDNLRSALSGAFDQYSNKLDEQFRLVDKEAGRAEDELVRMQRQLREFSGSRDLSRPVILRDISSLRQQLQSAKMKRASDENLYKATAQRIAEEQARRKKLVEDDPITKEFQSMLDVLEKRFIVTQKRYKSGSASAADLEDIDEKIIRARIDLIKRQEEVSNPPGGIVLSSLSDEMADLSTEVAVAAEEIRVFENQLKEAEELLEKADSYELLSLKADIAKQNLEETLLWQARLGRNIRSVQPPDVTVIGAD